MFECPLKSALVVGRRVSLQERITARISSNPDQARVSAHQIDSEGIDHNGEYRRFPLCANSCLPWLSQSLL